jgi:hypothetical protein
VSQRRRWRLKQHRHKGHEKGAFEENTPRIRRGDTGIDEKLGFDEFPASEATVSFLGGDGDVFAHERVPSAGNLRHDLPHLHGLAGRHLLNADDDLVIRCARGSLE